MNERNIIKNFKSYDKEMRLFYLLFFTSMSATLSFFEYLIPKPFPWIRIGLANSISLAFICSGYYKEALYISVLRPIIVSIFVGSIFSPGFFLSLFGSVSSSLLMIVSHNFFKKKLSIYGLSLIGSFFNSVSQVFSAYLFGLLNNIQSLMIISGFIIILSVFGGFITGYISSKLIKKL